jgi:DNA polymerase-3 subunit beta
MKREHIMTAVLDTPTVATPLAPSFMATTTREAMESAITFIAAALPSRPAVPVLGGVLLEADSDGVTVQGFDYDMATRQRVAGFGDGRVLVAGKMLKDMVAKLPKGGDVTMAIIDGKFTIRSGNRTFKLPLLLIEDYPDVPQVCNPVAIIDATEAARWTKVTIAAGTDDTLPVLTGVMFELDEAAGTVTTLATDRYRMALLTTSAVTTVTAKANVSAPTVAFVVKHLAKLGEVTIGYLPAVREPGVYREAMLSFSAGDRVVVTRLLEGEFPQVRKVLPETSTGTLDVAAKPLLEAVAAAKVVQPRNTASRFVVDITGATVQAGSLGEAEHSEFIGGTFEGEDLVTAYNPNYLVDGVKALGEQVRFTFNTGTRPVLLTSDAEPGYVYLLMPVRLSS